MPKQNWYVVDISKITRKCVVRQFSAFPSLGRFTKGRCIGVPPSYPYVAAGRTIFVLKAQSVRQTLLWSLQQYFCGVISLRVASKGFSEAFVGEATLTIKVWR